MPTIPLSPGSTPIARPISTPRHRMPMRGHSNRIVSACHAICAMSGCIERFLAPPGGRNSLVDGSPSRTQPAANCDEPRRRWRGTWPPDQTDCYIRKALGRQAERPRRYRHGDAPSRGAGARSCGISRRAAGPTRGQACQGESKMVSTRVRTLAVLLAALPASIASAQSPADFYKGRTVELDVGYSVGGAYDLYARTIGRFLGRHIPGNPTVVVKNMEGGGSLRLANWLFRVAPKDGSVLGTIGRGTGFDPILGQKGAQFDGTKFTWIGSANNEVSVCVAWNATSGIKKFDDLLTKEMTVGGTSMSADTDQFPKVLNAVFGTKMKIVSGYPGGGNVVLAMERGEVQGRCGWSWSSVMSTHKDWIDDKKMTVLVQLALRKHPELPDVPLIMDLAKNDEQRQILKLIFAR